MLIEDFYKLPPHKQDEIINAGGMSISPSIPTDAPKSCDSSSKPSVTSENGQTGTNVEISSTISTEAKEVVDTIPTSSPSDIIFDIKDPVELAYTFDEKISSGEVALHAWQIRFMLDFAKGGQHKSHPFQAVVRACNGSGKDKYIIAFCAVWLCMRYKETFCPITSSSGSQLDSQTCFHIRRLCESINRKLGTTIWKINYRWYECLPSRSFIKGFATDEPGKAEGFHPVDVGCRMGLFASEDKSIPDEINTAFNKCSGYTHRVHASTPGMQAGHFYDICSTAIPRDSIKDVNETDPADWIEYHITYKQCSHLDAFYLKLLERDLPGGKDGSAYKSQVDAEFGVTDEMVVIPYQYVWKAKKLPVDLWKQEDNNTGGLDLSDGGAETVLVVRNGNRLLKLIPFKFDDPDKTVLFLEEKFEENRLNNPYAYIFGDFGGIGSIILKRLKNRGWSNIRFRDNRAKSSRPKVYKNWRAESWFHLGQLIIRGEILLPDDPILIKQLSNCPYKLIDGQMHQVLSKLEMRSRGLVSPDRADGTVLAFNNYESTFVEIPEDHKEPFDKEEETTTNVVGSFDLRVSSQGKGDMYSLYNIDNGQKEFGDLQDEISNYNKTITRK